MLLGGNDEFAFIHRHSYLCNANLGSEKSIVVFSQLFQHSLTPEETSRNHYCCGTSIAIVTSGAWAIIVFILLNLVLRYGRYR